MKVVGWIAIVGDKWVPHLDPVPRSEEEAREQFRLRYTAEKVTFHPVLGNKEES